MRIRFGYTAFLLLRPVLAAAGLWGLLMGCAEIFDLPDPTPAPRISALSPGSGAAGVAVTITGENFSPTLSDNAVKFNGRPAVVTAASARELVALVPEHAGSGPVEVVVKRKATEGPVFYFFETPVISSISPTSGPAGTLVSVQGQYFDTVATNNLVRFGGKLAVVQPPATETLLRATVPDDAVTGEVTVTVNGITGTGPRFTVTGSPGPTHSISGLSPTSGPAGTVVSISGQGFSPVPAQNEVRFNGVTAAVTAASATQLTAVAPENGSTGLVSVTIGGRTVNGPTFTYVPITPAPTVTAISPTQGYAGDVVDITGTHFSTTPAGNVVKFNGKEAVVSAATATLLKAAVPEGAGTGPVTVTIGNQTATGPSFTYLERVPTISGFSPTSGPVGTTVTITGTHFGTSAAAVSVKFNGVQAATQTVTATTITTAVPPGASTGPLTVSIGSHTATSSTNFTVTPPATSGTVGVTGSLRYGRHSHTATLLPDGRVLVAGGAGIEQAPTPVPSEIYDSASGTWSLAAPLNTHRTFHRAVLLKDGKVLVIGGMTSAPGGGTRVANICELYDPATGQWTNTGSLNELGTFGGTPIYRRGFEAVLLADGRVLAAGGGNTSGPDGEKAEIYDPATGRWTFTGNMPDGARILFSLVLLKNGKVLASGGNSFATNATLYDPATNSWSPTGTLQTSPSLHTTTLLPDGKVLLAGGSTANGAVASCYLYDVTPGYWAATGPLNQARFYHESVLLPSNKVLAIGGRDTNGSNVLPFELYDPATGRWTLSGATSTGRVLHTITLLKNGNVLIVGGSNYRAAGTSICELYYP